MTNSPKILLQRFMVFTCTTSFIISIILIFQHCIVQELERLTTFNWFIYSYTIFSGIVFILSLRLFVNEKTKMSFHARFLTVYLIITGIISYFVAPRDVCFLLIPVNVLHYIIEVNINDIFVYHDWFAGTKEDRNGKELIEFLFKNNLPALEFAAKMKNARNLMMTLCFIEFAMLFVPGISIHRTPVSLYICSIIFYFSIFIILMMIGMFNRESYYSFLGFAKLTDNTRKLYKLVALIFCISLGLALILASDNAILHLPEFKQIISNVPGITYYEEMPVMPDTGGADFEALRQISKNNEPGILAEILKIIYKVLKYLLLGGAVTGFIFFIIKPLINGNLKDFIKKNPISKFFKMLIDEIKALFQNVFKKENDNLYSTVGARKFNDSIRNIIKGPKKSREKKLELDRLTKRFMILINWGTKKDIKYTSNLAPAEYTDLLESFFRSENQEEYCNLAHAIGKIYESALYGKELISKDEEKCFNDAVSSIISYGKAK